MRHSNAPLEPLINDAVIALRAGGVIAYPTEYCFGLGCDPTNSAAIERLLAIKQRQAQQGVILIAADLQQVEQWGDLSAAPLRVKIEQSWPGPNTWLLPARESVSEWVRGSHPTIAMRIPDHPVCQNLCQAFGGAIVSTSANRHGQAALLDAASVSADMGDELDYIIQAPVGAATAASTIRSGITGELIR